MPLSVPASLVRPLVLGAFLALALAGTAHASGSNMPWEQPLQQILELGPRAGRQDHRSDHHHHHGSHPCLRRDRRRLQAADPDRLRHLDRFRRLELLPLLLLLRRRGAGVMSGSIEGFEVPLHRSLTEPILLGGAPRAIAIVNGTVSAALGLGLRLWIAGLVLWVLGHSLAVFAAKRDPNFAEALPRHLRQRPWLSC